MRVSRAAQRSICLTDRAHDADLFEDAPAPKSARTPQRQCPVCGLLRPLVGRVCVACRENAGSLLTSQRRASEGTRRALDTAAAALTAAIERATDEHRAAWDRMTAARATMAPAEYARKHQAALRHKSGFGDIARAQAEIERLNMVLRDVEGKIATLADVVLIREASQLGWEE